MSWDTKMADDNDPLEMFFDAARREAQLPSDDLMARIEADAVAELDARAAPVAVAKTRGWRAVLDALGGWQAGAGLATAAALGLVLGVSVPDLSLDAATFLTDGYEIGDLAPGYGFEFLEDG